MLVPIRAGKGYRDSLYAVLGRLREQYGIERPGIADSLVEGIGSAAFLEGWRAAVRAMEEGLGNLDPTGGGGEDGRRKP